MNLRLIKPIEEFMNKMFVDRDPQKFSSWHSGALIWNKNSNHESVLVNQRDNRNSLNLNTDYNVGSDSQQQDLTRLNKILLGRHLYLCTYTQCT